MNVNMKLIKELIYKLTEGKIELVKYDEYIEIKHTIINQNQLLIFIKENIVKDFDIPYIRSNLEKVLNNIELLKNNTQKIYNILLIFTELATNMIKHANGGIFIINIFNKIILMEFNDDGKGINLEKIPYVTLTNYSSKEDSLGYGFSICSALANKIYINTSEKGTNILVIFNID
ncbi:MAG: ATP-binding protein [bacterium]|jgi:anti-sigma regulatory factor (Ser/Thr protein kinase)